MDLLKTSFLNGMAVLIKLASLFIINKLLAIFVGPSGYALIGQFHNFIQLITGVLGTTLQNSIVTHTAKQDSIEAQKYHWQSCVTVSLLYAVVTGTLISLFAPTLAEHVLGSVIYTSVFYWLAGSLVFFLLNIVALSILNGLGAIKYYVLANIIGSLSSLLLSLVLINSFELYGAFLSLTLYQCFNFIASLYFVFRYGGINISSFIGKLRRSELAYLWKYAQMATVVAILAPSTQFLVRNLIIDEMGIMEAGYWEALNRLSSAYIMFFTLTISVYFVPKFSSLNTVTEIRAELSKGILIIFPISVFASLATYIGRDNLIIILFSDQFLEIRNLVGLQMAGDAAKVIAWLLAYTLISKHMVSLFVASEVLFSVTYLLLNMIFIEKFGLFGAALAHCVNSVIYVAFMFPIIFKSIKSSIT